MTAAHAEPQVLIFGDHGRSANSRVLHWLSPVLIAIAAPVIALVVAAPGSIVGQRAMVMMALFAVFLVAGTAYILSVLLPGIVSRVELSTEKRQVRLTQKGMLASSATAIAFARISNVRVATRYDDDGYGSDVAELVLLDGTAIALPATSPEDITAIRRAIGLG